MLFSILFSASLLLLGGPVLAQQKPAPGGVDLNDPVAVQMASAQGALEQHDYHTAEGILQELAKSRPNDAHVLFDLGFAQEHLHQDDAALQSYKAAIAADAIFADPHEALAMLYASHDRTDDARREFLTVANLASASPEQRGHALRVLATVDMAANPTQASEEILQAIQLTGEQPGDAGLAAETAFLAGDYAAAEREFVKVLSEHPDNIDARVGLGTALMRQRKFADAEQTLQQGLKLSPENAPLTVTLAEVYSGNGKDAEAISTLETLWKRNQEVPGNVLVERMLARLYLMNDRPADAEPLLREVAAAEKNDPQALDVLGEALVKQAKYAEGERVLSAAVSQRAAFHDDKAWGEAASHLAFAAQRNHNPQLALQALAARATVLPETPASLFLQAASHDALHQNRDAVRFYKAFLAVAGGKFPDEEFEARHRLVALQHEK